MNTQKEEFRKWMLDTFGTQDANDYAGTFTEEIAIKFAEFKQKLNKHDVSNRLSIEELIWQKLNPDEPFNADEFYDWASENSRQALGLAFGIYRELGR